MTTKRVQYPDGKGGFIEVEGEVHRGSMANLDKQAETTLKVAEKDAHDHMLKVLQFEQTRARDFNMSPEQRAWAMVLMVISMRENYPGGAEEFDKINSDAYAYYLKNA